MSKILCGLCDMVYDSENEEEVMIHEHLEPQSGPYRKAWLESGMSYDKWLKETTEGKEWGSIRERLVDSVLDRESFPIMEDWIGKEVRVYFDGLLVEVYGSRWIEAEMISMDPNYSFVLIRWEGSLRWISLVGVVSIVLVEERSLNIVDMNKKK